MNLSPGPSRLTHFRKLQQKKYRDEFAEFVVENPLIVRDAFDLNVIPREVIVTKRFLESHELLITTIQQKISAHVFAVDDGELLKLSSLEHPQGILAIYKKQQDLVDESLPIIFLNGVSDPSNVGAIMRSAAAFGVSSYITDDGSADPYNPKAVSAAKEAIFLLQISRKPLSFLKTISGWMPIFALEAHDGVSLDAFQWQQPFCLLIGSEAHGITHDAREFIDSSITIATHSQTIESLNVAAAAAIALHSSFFAIKNSVNQE
ncbi:MAG: RNA methyltransferase [Patescibacteria group bacterium]|jgi:TrmH family RNA methyltransferase